MDKDLQDAYTALRLLRADLIKTRHEKKALEACVKQYQTHQLQSDVVQTRRIQEIQQMTYEDLNSHLWRLTLKHEICVIETKQIEIDNKWLKLEKPHEVSNYQEKQDEEKNETLLHQEHEESRATEEEQTQMRLTQENRLLLQKEELETLLEKTRQMLQMEKQNVVEIMLKQQTIEKQKKSLKTQMDILKTEKTTLEKENTQLKKDVAAFMLTNSTLMHQLKEKEEELVVEKSKELRLDQKRNELVEEVRSRLERENVLKEKELRDEHQRERVELQRENEMLQLKLHRETEKLLQDEEDMRKEHAKTVSELERICIELKAQITDFESKLAADATKHDIRIKEAEEQYATAMSTLEMKLMEVQKQLAVSEANRLTESQKYEEKLTEALRTLEGQQEDKDQQLCILNGDLKAALAQLEVSKGELDEECKNHKEQLKDVLQQLHDQQRINDRNVIDLRDLDSKLSRAQLQLSDSETNHLAQVNEYEKQLMEALQMAEQHETNTQMLALEIKTLQQENGEAQHMLKLKTEELVACQSMFEEKSEECIRRMCQAQKHCESLETQLLSAEDHRTALYADTSIHDTDMLQIFHGRTDDDIIAMSPWKSWSLLGSGIKKMADFLPHFQTLLGSMNDVLTLCEAHAVALPVLCKQLERDVASEKEHTPLLFIALHLLRLAGMLKATYSNNITVTTSTVQSFRERVLDALALWYECDAGGNDQDEKKSLPTPKFTTTSREIALILQNWTNDRTKQLGVRRWLARMEAYPGVPQLRGASVNRLLDILPEGCTLELEDMTLEVKDAFLLLVIPILKQNQALHVRVFTRYIGNHQAMVKQQCSNDEAGTEKVWSMRIHVQSTVTKACSAKFELSPSSRGLPSPRTPSSPTSSVSSSTSSNSRLQIIQERLQYLHHHDI